MRHNRKFNHLSRKAAHRKSMLANMSVSLITHKRISTTVPKAKALQVYVEPILTKSKEDTTNSRRQVFSKLKNKEAVTELFQNVSQKIADRPGGYTRILKTGRRLGDNAEMCIIELVDYNENMLKEPKKKRATRTRRSSSRRKAETVETTQEQVSEEVVEETAPVAEDPKIEEVKEPVAKAKAETKTEPKKEAKAEKPAKEEAKTEPKKEVREEKPVKKEAKAEEPAEDKKAEEKAE